MIVERPTAKQKRTLNGLLDGFRMLGPIESVVWLADYFDGHAAAMMKAGHDHCGRAAVVDELVSDLRELVVKYKARMR